MSNIFGIDVSALQAFQQGIAVTSNNVANANTPGYNVETLNLGTAAPQDSGGVAIGAGVVANGVTRAYSQAATNQFNGSQSSLGQLNALQSYTSQIDNLFGTTAGGLTTALQNYYNGWSAVADNPSSTAARQALLGDANALAQNLNSTSAQLGSLNADVNGRISSDVSQINSYSAEIAKLNTQIAASAGSGQQPNTLLDQRDQLVSSLSQLSGVTTTANTDGSINVFVGSGQPLVLDGNAYTLTTVPNPFNGSQLEVASSSSNGSPISSSITSGDLGGLLAARSQSINPAQNALGQIATAVAQSTNAQQGAGLDLTGQLGGALFSIAAPAAAASQNNAGGATASVSLTGAGALTADDYLLTYKGGAYSLTDQTTGANVALAGAGTAASPLTAVGLSIVVSGTPASGDQFLVQPTAQAAGSIRVALTDPAGIAAAGAVRSAAGGSNIGTGTIGAASVVNAADPNLLTTATIAFTSPTTYSINGAGSFAYTAGGAIAANGWRVQISGAPATGDTFSVQRNAGGTGDNANALAAANRQTAPYLSNGTESISGAVSALISGAGAQAQQVNTAQAAQTAVNTQARTNLQSINGVNLDEEAAKLMQWQQAYQASAQALSVANGLFTTLIDSIKNG